MTLEAPPTEPVWWVSREKGKPTRYTKVQFWMEARRELGGHPERVTHKGTITRLEKARGEGK